LISVASAGEGQPCCVCTVEGGGQWPDALGGQSAVPVKKVAFKVGCYLLQHRNGLGEGACWRCACLTCALEGWSYLHDVSLTNSKLNITRVRHHANDVSKVAFVY